MSWTINLNGHRDPDGTEADAIEQLVKDFTKLAKEADVGLTYVSANVPNKGQRTYFNSAAGFDLTEEVEDDSDVEEEGEEDD